MTVKQLYEWAKESGVEDCHIRIDFGEEHYYQIIPDTDTEKQYDGSIETVVVL